MTPARIVGPVGLALERLGGTAALGIARQVGPAMLVQARLVGVTGAGDAPAPAPGFRLLTEAGDFLTTETGNRLLLE